jgi:uncharacterized membrane protein YfcA
MDAIKNFINSLNEKGIPVPMLRDPRTGQASLTATLVFLSFNTALLGQIGKVTNLFGPVDLVQANYLLMLSLGAYLGRRIQANSATKTTDLSEESK